MRDQEIIGLWEAYQQVHSQPQEEVEQLDEDAAYDRNRKRAAQRAQARNEARARGQTGSVPGVGYVSPRPERATYTDSAGVVRHHTGARMPKKEDQNESYDLFDYILEHLVAEGYADTNEAAISIMANMSEEWRESIVESIARGSAPNSPTGNLGGLAGDLLKKGTDFIKKNIPQSGGTSTMPGDGKPYKDGPLWDSNQKPEDVKNTPTSKPTVRKPNPSMRDEPLW